MFSSCEKVPLTEFATIIMGQSPDSSTYNNTGEGVPFYQGKTEFGEKYVTVKSFCTDPKKMAKTNDILMSVRAPVGSVNITQGDCCIGRGLAAITPIKGKSSRDFLFESLKAVENEIESMGNGSTFKAINKDQMSKILIPHAELELQNQFVEFVQQVDKSKLIAQQCAEKYDLLVKSRFIEMMNRSSNVVSLGNIITPYKAKRCGISNYPVLSITRWEGLILQSNRFKKEIASHDKTQYKVIPKNKLVVAFPIDEGLICVQSVVDCGIVSPAYNVYSIDDCVITPIILQYILRSDLAIQYYVSKLRGTTLRRRTISSEDLYSMQIKIPSMNEQLSFLKFIEQIDKSKFIIDSNQTIGK